MTTPRVRTHPTLVALLVVVAVLMFATPWLAVVR